MLRSHKITLNPNDKQSTYFVKACGVARFAFNWALAEWEKQYTAGGKPTQASLRRQLNAMKREQFPWMLEVTKNAPQMAIIHLGQAFQNFFAGRAKYPTFKKKGIHDSFTLSNDQFIMRGKKIRIPNLGWVKMKEKLRFSGKVMSATVSRQADKWFVSITVDTNDIPPLCTNQTSVGVDLGINRLATLSNGTMIVGSKPYKTLLHRLQRMTRSLSRKKKGSKNRAKAKTKLARTYARIANIRRDELHKLTTELTSQYGLIAIEDLNVRGMMSNHHLARAVGDMGFREFRRQLEYKSAMRGGTVVAVERWFASSKICSTCDFRMENMTLSVRKWNCPNCGSRHDRDLNAAMNIEKQAVSSTVAACGEESSGGVHPNTVKLASMKQESNIKTTCR